MRCAVVIFRCNSILERQERQWRFLASVSASMQLHVHVHVHVRSHKRKCTRITEIVSCPGTERGDFKSTFLK